MEDALRQIAELTFQRLQELDKVFRLRVHLGKVAELVVEFFEAIALVGVFGLENLQNGIKLERVLKNAGTDQNSAKLNSNETYV